MKLKVNTRILFVAILLATLVLAACQPQQPKREVIGLPFHPDPTGSPTDTFWGASGHIFVVIPTAAFIIVDEKGATVSQAGIVVTSHFSNGNLFNNTTAANGSSSLQMLGVTYPFTVTASDGGKHQFSTVTVENLGQLQQGSIKIVESPMTNIK